MLILPSEKQKGGFKRRITSTFPTMHLDLTYTKYQYLVHCHFTAHTIKNKNQTYTL